MINKVKAAIKKPIKTLRFLKSSKVKMIDNKTEIKGHRVLNSEEIEAINELKEQAENCRKLIEQLYLSPNTDKRSLAIAKTNLQQGFMWAVRSIAKPTTF